MNVVPRTVLVRPADPLGDLGRRAVHAQRVGDGAEAGDIACGALSKKIVQFHSQAILNPFSMVYGGSPMFQLDISNCSDQLCAPISDYSCLHRPGCGRPSQYPAHPKSCLCLDQFYPGGRSSLQPACVRSIIMDRARNEGLRRFYYDLLLVESTY